MALLLKYDVCAGGEHYTLHYDDGTIVKTTLTELLEIPQAEAGKTAVEKAVVSVTDEASLKAALDSIKTQKDPKP